MRIVSKQSWVLYPLVVLLTLCSGILLLLGGVVIRVNFDQPWGADLLLTCLFLSWMALTPLALLAEQLRKVTITSTNLEVSYLMGLIRTRHRLADLRQSPYTFRSSGGILIGLENGRQITLGKRQYRNYEALRSAIEQNIPADASLKLKNTSRILTIMIWSGVIILLLLLWSLWCVGRL